MSEPTTLIVPKDQCVVLKVKAKNTSLLRTRLREKGLLEWTAVEEGIGYLVIAIAAGTPANVSTAIWNMTLAPDAELC